MRRARHRSQSAAGCPRSPRRRLRSGRSPSLERPCERLYVRRTQVGLLVMKKLMLRGTGLLVATILLGSAAGAQAPVTLTPDDRTAIQGLVTSYARVLGSCAAEEFADLFAPDTGYFASGFRGMIMGRERLIALVQSERHCITAPGAKPAARPSAPALGPTLRFGGGNTSTDTVPGLGIEVAIDTSGGVVRGIIDLGPAGQYQDEYVKTAKGWRFASRTVITLAEKAAGLDAAEMLAIQKVAGPELGDNYAPDQYGVKRLRSSGVAISVSATGVTRKEYQKAGGYCDDVFGKLGPGQWRIKSRTCVAGTP